MNAEDRPKEVKEFHFKTAFLKTAPTRGTHFHMWATLRAMFDGKRFLPEIAPPLAPGKTYLLGVEEADSNLISSKLPPLRQAMQNQAFLDDLEQVAEDFTALDAED